MDNQLKASSVNNEAPLDEPEVSDLPDEAPGVDNVQLKIASKFTPQEKQLLDQFKNNTAYLGPQ